MWNQLSPQQQQYLMAMLMGGHAAVGGMPGAMPNPQADPRFAAMIGQPSPQLGAAQQPAMPMGAQLGNPLMAGGNSAVSPQQQAMMQQYMQMLNSPQGFGATANSNVPVWQLMMGRSPMYGTGGAVP